MNRTGRVPRTIAKERALDTPKDEFERAVTRIGVDHATFIRSLLIAEKTKALSQASALFSIEIAERGRLTLIVDDCEAALNAIDVLHNSVMSHA